MLWIKAIHVIFVVSWFAALLYLPRLFVYHTQVTSDSEHQRFSLMERKLYGMGLIAMIGTWVFGVWLIMLNPGLMHGGWLHAKLGLVILVSGYYGWLKANLRRFAAGKNTRSERYWRVANEVPAVVLVAVVILVIVKPF